METRRVYDKMKLQSDDEKWMARAIELAIKGKGRTAPNPSVGAVIVKNNKIIGEGFHRKAGLAHAEVAAIRSCKTSTKGATMFVTLEPCSHHGRTPPCVDAIISAGITEVVIGSRDRSPKKGSLGMAALKKAGLKVRSGVLKKECDLLVADFIKHSLTGLPFVILKTAITLDGKVATESGDSKWISSEQSRKLVHKIRSRTDAIMVGSGTVSRDDPKLTARYGRSKRNPVRVIVDGKLKISMKANVVKTACTIPTIIMTTHNASAAKIAQLKKMGARILVCPSGREKVNLKWAFAQLGALDIMSVLLEGSGELPGAAIKAGMVDRVMFFIAPKIVGGSRSAITGLRIGKMSDALKLCDVEIYRSGPDVVMEGFLVK